MVYYIENFIKKNMQKPDSKKNLLLFLKKHKIEPKKSLGQNFLIDKNILSKITTSANLQKNDVILEIGPGPGILTKALLEENCYVYAIEKDKKFAKILKHENLEIIEEDFLNVDLKKFLNEASNKIKVIANIPYSISKEIVLKLLKNYKLFSSITLLVQDEFAKKVTSKNSFLNIFSSIFSNVEYKFMVPKSCFYPAPHVNSAVLQFTIKDQLDLKNDTDIENFQIFLLLCFSQKRKMLSTILKKDYDKEILKKALLSIHKSEKVRAEEMMYEDFLKLFKKLNSL
jgi:16S rRNA (adenine1518-N6/adenine1519-N6)-dimethyltransferase